MASRKRKKAFGGDAPVEEEGNIVVEEEIKVEKKRKGKKTKLQKRKHKNAPTVMSSKKPVGRFRQVVDVKKQAVRDPRFTSWTGDLDQSKFRKAYDFLSSYSKNLFKSLSSFPYVLFNMLPVLAHTLSSP